MGDKIKITKDDILMTYTQGIDENHVIKTISSDNDIDLTVFIEAFKALKNELQELPKIKTESDQETLTYWNEVVYIDGQSKKALINNQAIELYEEITAIKNVGLLPSKYDNEYKQLENYINNL